MTDIKQAWAEAKDLKDRLGIELDRFHEKFPELSLEIKSDTTMTQIYTQHAGVLVSNRTNVNFTLTVRP